MATLYFRVFESAAATAKKVLQDGAVAIGTASAQSAAINSDNTNTGKEFRKVRLFADATCFVTWGEDPTAESDGSDGMPVGTENPEYVDIQVGHKIAVIER